MNLSVCRLLPTQSSRGLARSTSPITQNGPKHYIVNRSISTNCQIRKCIYVDALISARALSFALWLSLTLGAAMLYRRRRRRRRSKFHFTCVRERERWLAQLLLSVRRMGHHSYVTARDMTKRMLAIRTHHAQVVAATASRYRIASATIG